MAADPTEAVLDAADQQDAGPAGNGHASAANDKKKKEADKRKEKKKKQKQNKQQRWCAASRSGVVSSASRPVSALGPLPHIAPPSPARLPPSPYCTRLQGGGGDPAKAAAAQARRGSQGEPPRSWRPLRALPATVAVGCLPWPCRAWPRIQCPECKVDTSAPLSPPPLRLAACCLPGASPAQPQRCPRLNSSLKLTISLDSFSSSSGTNFTAATLASQDEEEIVVEYVSAPTDLDFLKPAAQAAAAEEPEPAFGGLGLGLGFGGAGLGAASEPEPTSTPVSLSPAQLPPPAAARALPPPPQHPPSPGGAKTRACTPFDRCLTSTYACSEAARARLPCVRGRARSFRRPCARAAGPRPAGPCAPRPAPRLPTAPAASALPRAHAPTPLPTAPRPLRARSRTSLRSSRRSSSGLPALRS
jgi:hypothetical protein